MKQFFSSLAFLLTAVAAFGSDGPLPAPQAANSAKSAKVITAGAVRFEFSNIKAQDHTDSVLVIFDKFDHTGAGVIFQVYSADDQNGINISEVPAGKYYVTIQCLGLHHDRMEKTITIKKQKTEKVHFDLEASEIFSKDNVKIPVDRTNFSDLAILKSK